MKLCKFITSCKAQTISKRQNYFVNVISSTTLRTKILSKREFMQRGLSSLTQSVEYSGLLRSLGKYMSPQIILVSLRVNLSPIATARLSWWKLHRKTKLLNDLWLSTSTHQLSISLCINWTKCRQPDITISVMTSSFNSRLHFCCRYSSSNHAYEISWRFCGSP